MPEIQPPVLELADIQGIVLRRRPTPYHGTHALLRIDDAAEGREMLRRLIPHIVSAADWENGRDLWVAVMLTYAGLAALGTPPESLASFPKEMRDGMASRAEALGDTGESSPDHWLPPYGTGEIHVALTILADTEEIWREKIALALAQIDDLPGISLLGRNDFAQLPGGRTSLGYKDGISFPCIAGSSVPPLTGAGPEIAAGEFIFGYPGEAGTLLPMPFPDALGRNGTLIGFRKLHTRVADFRRFLRANANSEAEEEKLAAKLLGRWRSGAPLALAPDKDDPLLAEDHARNNNFDYADDPKGLVCPFGAHIRRSNPRETPMPVLTDVNLHRIIRHGTTYGPPLPDGVLEDDGAERGIFFIFLSARAPATFEFLKSHWTNDGNFLNLGTEKDPIAGAHDGTGVFTIPQRPIRRRLQGLSAFTVTRGGEYGFLPSLSALRWLSALT